MIKDLEIKMWEAAKANNSEDFLRVVDENAILVCGGCRCTGREYAEIVKMFDCKNYEISNYEIVAESENLVQVHYILKMDVEHSENSDLAGKFHITSTWAKRENIWKLIFNTDSRIFE